ncbi:putative L,D-transpeptidase ErfK/SrfK [Saliniradius amylolyticus]|uniref:Putative L,D-transpeptidase ErfK/SrfK n=1 Tax=Saliniradius amylolyticus TaxID=2183582 RepID=A0A2S2E2N7_9ALTE|nr:L,D-transpeptidase family protein [Saliniradius amylolyticus]AWL11908.1 putative L,D-transpeptidase ErfK/SrfK [Saliniradius amylolyticus]
MRLIMTLVGCLFALLVVFDVQARLYHITPDSDLIGTLQYTSIEEGDTLVDLASEYGLGIEEMTAANPEIDVWLPKVGQVVTIPSRFILPEGERRGIVVNLAEFRLYHFLGNGKVMTAPVGIGRQGWETPTGETLVTGKNTDPWWRVPDSIRAQAEAEGRELPEFVRPGPDNPLGKHVVTLNWPGYLFHGTNKDYGVGTRISHGCLRLYDKDIADLYQNVTVGTPVRIIYQPVKAGWHAGQLMLEVHRIGERAKSQNMTPATQAVVKARGQQDLAIDWSRVTRLMQQAQGIPNAVSI